MSGTSPVERWLNTSELRMHYLDWGPPGQVPQEPDTGVLALHGLASSCHWYDLTMPHLADSYRCIAPDQRGHGKTDQPPTGYDWNSVAKDAVEALDHLGIRRAAVLGHSWGGYVALSVAARYPERVSQLVLIDGGFLDWTLWPGANWEWYKNMLSPRDVQSKREDFLDHLREQLADCWSDQLEGIVMSMVQVGSDGRVRDILEPSNHAHVLEAMWNEPASTMFPNVRCPTLIVPAQSNKIGGNPEFARIRQEMVNAAQSALKDCEVRWINDTTHDIGYHKPVELAQVIRDFLSR